MVATVLFSQRSSCSFVCSRGIQGGGAQRALASRAAPPAAFLYLSSHLFLLWNLP